ncbi:MAG: nucleoside triphosphate pyrophosphohydrolase [Novosphingobium sp.]
MSDPMEHLLNVMATLRDPVRGCDWDRAQDFASIAPYTIEEAYEVADAIARNDIDALRDELGDLLLQVVFHGRIAEEAGHFSFADIARSISKKLESRHPHIFGDVQSTSEHQSDRWERLKAAERSAAGADSALSGVALALPALVRAEKLQKRAARVGFDWPDPAGPSAKIAEELAEFVEAAQTGDRQNILEEAGDLLFAVVNFLRKHQVAPEDALRAANAKFERRFRAMEQLAAQHGDDFATLSLDQQEELWSQVKLSES